ncbi:PLP-dependent transferase [Marinicella sediminis]|uniref:PLP-dependent transferase n=1 Tax=Marinicella sediminis TaxID=1792834 RepID=A0ABV7J9X4_9GAMM|nr:PLP-dependent transferase [Marinicella sediminis]
MSTLNTVFDSIKTLLKNLPKNWLELTTHRLDIYRESQAKSEFLSELKGLISQGKIDSNNLEQLPTAYDYIRLGHQLSSLLEWVLAEINQVPDDQVITFASKTMPVLALLRHNTIHNRSTYIYWAENDSETWQGGPLIDEARLKSVYGYQYHMKKVTSVDEVPAHHDDHAMVVFVSQKPLTNNLSVNPNIDITVNVHPTFGSYVVIHHSSTNVKDHGQVPKHSTSAQIVGAVQHVRRRETIAMSPLNCYNALNEVLGISYQNTQLNTDAQTIVTQCIRDNTGSQAVPLVASSGLSIQYAILMGLVESALTTHPDKAIKIILPPNCYGGTNDQSRRVAELIPQVSIVDLLVDGGADLVNSLETTLETVAAEDGVPIILVEIPTNPRVEVPNMQLLGQTLKKQRLTATAIAAIEPTLMVDQTFCPNVQLLQAESELNGVKTISFASGSKFPSGGRCIAGYCAANQAASELMSLVAKHLKLSDNEADARQINTLAETMPSMPDRIIKAYRNTRDFVSRIQTLLPSSKVFYVTETMAKQGFMPSVFSLDLPVNEDSPQERMERQKELNKKLIQFMIGRHPNECKNCVSYGQLKGSYWTIPATSTQGTTKESDKDYVVRASLAPDVDVDSLLQSFAEFCKIHGL